MSTSEYLNHRAKDGQHHDHVDIDLRDAHTYTKGLRDVQNQNCRNPEQDLKGKKLEETRLMMVLAGMKGEDPDRHAS